MAAKLFCNICTDTECINYYTLKACIVKSQEQLPEDHCAVNVKPQEEQEISVYANLPVSAFTTDSETGKIFPHLGKNAFTSPGSELDSDPGSESDSESDPGSESDSESDPGSDSDSESDSETDIKECRECFNPEDDDPASKLNKEGYCSECACALT